MPRPKSELTKSGKTVGIRVTQSEYEEYKKFREDFDMQFAPATNYFHNLKFLDFNGITRRYESWIWKNKSLLKSVYNYALDAAGSIARIPYVGWALAAFVLVTLYAYSLSVRFNTFP